MLLHNRATATAWASVIRLPSVKWGTAKRTNAKFCAKVYVPNRHISRSFFFSKFCCFYCTLLFFIFLNGIIWEKTFQTTSQLKVCSRSLPKIMCTSRKVICQVKNNLNCYFRILALWFGCCDNNIAAATGKL